MIYTFENVNTGEIREVEMSMKNYQPYKGADGNEECWRRVYEVPQVNMGVSTSKKIDPWDNNSFVERTGKMKGSYGDMQDHAKELSEQRASESTTGEDPVKRKYLDDYAKSRGGKKHVADLPKKFENNHIKVEL